jgi:hypothetical protein
MADTDEMNADAPPPAQMPRARTSGLTIGLILLNFFAVLAFGALLWMANSKRMEWARAIFFRDLGIVGLPLDDKDTSGARQQGQQQPFADLDPPLLKDAYKNRGGAASDKFRAIFDTIPVEIGIDDLDTSLVSRYFSEAGVSDPVTTVAAELEKVRSKLPGQLEEAASKVADRFKDKPAAEKRSVLRKMLFPLCTEGRFSVDLNRKIETTPDGSLDAAVKEAALRRMWCDILRPLEVFRPSEPADGEAKRLVARVVEIVDVKDKGLQEKVSLEELAGHFSLRCQQFLGAADWIHPTIRRGIQERRRCVAFLLLTVTQVEEPAADRSGAAAQGQPQDKGQVGHDGRSFVHFSQEGKQQEGEKKDEQPKGDPGAAQPGARELARPFRPYVFTNAEDRVTVVCGLRDFNQACEDLSLVTEIIERQVIEAVERDRGQFAYPLAVRITDPTKFATELVALMDKMKIAVPDAKAFIKGMADRLTEMQKKGGDIGIRLTQNEDGEQLLGEIVRTMDAYQVVIPAVPSQEVNKTAFERSVYALLSANAIGFMGQYSLALKRIQDLALVIQRREQHYGELKSLADDHQKLLISRNEQEKSMLKGLIEARTETRKMALELQRLQYELFTAQVDLAGAHAYVQYLERRLRELEQKQANAKVGKGR